MPTPEKKPRNELIYKLRDEQGLSYNEIAKMVGIGKQTVYDIYKRREKKLLDLKLASRKDREYNKVITK